MNRPIQVKQTDSENRGGKFCGFKLSLSHTHKSKKIFFLKMKKLNLKKKFSFGKFFNFPPHNYFYFSYQKKYNLNYLFISALSPPLPTLHEYETTKKNLMLTENR